MAEGSRSARRASSPSWLASLMGAVFLISAGFMLGLVVGVVKEEPELVMGHLGGQSEEVRWSAQEAELGVPDVAAAGPYLDSPGDPQTRALDTDDVSGLEPPLAVEEDAASDVPEPTASAQTTPEASRHRESLPRPAPASPQSTGFSVQVGAFSESDAADRVAVDLRSKGFPVYVTPSAGSRDGRWRVRVGPMATRAEAEDTAQQLKTREQLPTWVLSEGGS